jgi:intracellular sulfur oxidation DsrE/DsrF family protein
MRNGHIYLNQGFTISDSNPCAPVVKSQSTMYKVKTFIATAALAAASLFAHAGTMDSPDFWTTPTVRDYGKMHFLPNGAFKPQPGHTYKVVFALTQGGKKPDEVSPALDHVARAVNLYVASGVPLSKLKFVAVASGSATSLVLDDAHYRTQFGVANPNLPLIAELKKDGITIAVCGQAMAEHHFEDDWIDPGVTLSLSALTTVTTLQQAGYALMPL